MKERRVGLGGGHSASEAATIKYWISAQILAGVTLWLGPENEDNNKNQFDPSLHKRDSNGSKYNNS